MKDTEQFIFKDIRSSFGSGESDRLYVVIDISSGQTEVVIEKTISERYPIQKIAEVNKLYDKITGGGGRKLWKLEELV